MNEWIDVKFFGAFIMYATQKISLISLLPLPSLTRTWIVSISMLCEEWNALSQSISQSQTSDSQLGQSDS